MGKKLKKVYHKKGEKPHLYLLNAPKLGDESAKKTAMIKIYTNNMIRKLESKVCVYFF